MIEKNVKLVPVSFRPFKRVRRYIGFLDVFHVRELEITDKGRDLDKLQEKFIEEVRGSESGWGDNESEGKGDGRELRGRVQASRLLH